nr:SprT family zinc-dependent metalloprotease [uncultured Noviherbaspirillum sp.]
MNGQRQLQLGSMPIDYTLQRSTRRTIGFVISDSGLRVTAPRWVLVRDIELAIRSKEAWIVAKLQERQERAAERARQQMEWRDGASLPYLGGSLTLRVRPAATRKPAVHHDEATGELAVHLPEGAESCEQALKDTVRDWLQRQAHALFAQRLPLYAMRLGVQYCAFRLTSARTQWGSCTAKGIIRLNWRLVHFGQAQIDYVIAHELAHLREMNHSPRFWALVASVFPDYAAARKVLRERGPELLPVF